MNDAIERISFKDEWPNNSARLIKLRAHFYMLEQDVRRKLQSCNNLLSRYENKSIVCTHKDTLYRVAGESLGYATVLDLIHTSMRELGMEYQQ